MLCIISACMHSYSTCNHGDLRLYGGRSRSDGVAEVCINGLWGNICYQNLDEAVSNVFCRQLLERDNVGRHIILHNLIKKVYAVNCIELANSYTKPSVLSKL